MTSRVFGLRWVAVAVAALAACKSDPTADLVGGASRLTLEFDSLNVTIADSSKVIAKVLDQAGDPVTATISMASCNTGVATVSSTSQAPLVQSAFFIKGITFGGTCAIATSGAFTDTVKIATYPATIAVTSGADTLLSGNVYQYTFEYRDAAGNPVAGVPDPVFGSSAVTVATVLPSPLGSVQAKSPGAAIIGVTGFGPLETGLTTTKGVFVIPGTFGGTLSPAAANPGDVVRVDRAVGGPPFDSDTRLFVNRFHTIILSRTADSIKFLMPALGKTGIVGVLMDRIGPDQIALADSSKLSSASATDAYSPADEGWNTAPDITSLIPAPGQSSWLVAAGVPSNPPSTCPEDRFGFGPAGTCILLKFTLAAPTTLTFTTDWVGSSTDVDVLVCSDSTLANFDVTFTTYSPCADDGLAGATSAQPEVAGGVLYPAGTYWLALQDYDGSGVVSYYVKIEQ